MITWLSGHLILGFRYCSKFIESVRISNSNSNSLLYQTPGVYVQGGSNKQFNSSSDISFGKKSVKIVHWWGGGGGEQQSKGQS